MANNFKNLKATKFLSMLSARQERFESAKAEMPQTSDQAMVIAKALHPKKQFLVVESIRDMSADCKTFTLVPDKEKGTTQLAYFGAGKYLTVFPSSFLPDIVAY